MEETNNSTALNITENYIDLEGLLAKKNVKLPKFALRWVKRILHLDEINGIIYTYRDIQGLDFVHAFLEGSNKYDLNISIEVVNEGNIPTDGFPIVAGNHPLGGPDGLALMGAIGHYRQDILFPVNDFLLYIPQLKPLFVPIDKVHRNSSNAQGIEAAFAAQNMLLYFPAGLCSRKQKGGVIRDLEWKPTFIKKAIKYHRDVVPFFFDAQNSRRFYNLARFRERLGIKFNFEMVLLPDEMFRQRGKRLRLIIGKPIPYTTFDDRHTPKEWAQLVKDYIYRLKDNPDETFIK